jgi:predicted nucleic acid-binding Zn ribbon protein
MKDVLQGAELESKIQQHTCLLVWDEVVGEKMASAAQPEFVRDGVLFVATKSAVWSNELTFYKREMISKLNSRVGKTVIKDIVFKVGRISRKRPAVPVAEDKPDLEGIKLSDEELKGIESAASSAGEESSEFLRRLMVTAMKLEKWKKAHGWMPCKKCGVLQRTASGVCPVCELPTE